MYLDTVYQPIKNELRQVDSLLTHYLRAPSDKSILEITDYLLSSKGKRLRPALVILSANAASGVDPAVKDGQLINIACAVELIHIASLVHDDVIDRASLRRNKPSISRKWGNELSIVLGNYLYSMAFKLISSCRNQEVLGCLADAMLAMCEGEFSQIKERDNLSLRRKEYLVIVRKKTASFMASCCRAGAALVNGRFVYRQALAEYGLNFGIAFQVRDDYLDLTSTDKELGKTAGLDLTVGEFTLPLLFLSPAMRRKLRKLKNESKDVQSFRKKLTGLGVFDKTRDFVGTYIAKAKQSLGLCLDSEYKISLERLADRLAIV